MHMISFQMSFDELYESCFRNASLVKVPQGKSAKDDASLLVTLDYVMNTSQYVVFFLTAGAKGADMERMQVILFQMSFDELYESCFRNASLVKVPQGKSAKDDASLLVTLDYVMNTSQYVVFFLTAGAKGADMGLKLDSMIRKKNEKGDKDKAQRLVFFKRTQLSLAYYTYSKIIFYHLCSAALTRLCFFFQKEHDRREVNFSSPVFFWEIRSFVVFSYDFVELP
ncbi:unnamed protein product [Nippostrongylus brasiliensis]|uniref:Actin-binding, cofilin/tropomyosin type n=1 Tax=Nippostrongylus brasiliensis TaxID=27835 RepID=A0A0N4YNV0_NIPBR|nr:unnamed protein product [Nippostrongylus brasiliensis]